MIFSEGPKLHKLEICSLHDIPDHGTWAVLTEDRADEPHLRRICTQRGASIAVREVWRELFPEASLLISSAICGGDIRTRFEEAARARSCYLLLEPIRMRFKLPCPDGCGEFLQEIPDGPHFYSDALFCNYAHSPGAVVLWDTEQTMERKIRAAMDAGFLGLADLK